ncbi:MAG: RNA polymerase sigma factor [Gammaproteobacteria bacterium]
MQERFTTLLTQHSGIVFKVALTYCWHKDDRAELQQEITTQLWRAFPKYDPGQRFSTWMYRIALNVAISWLRKHSLTKRHFVPYDERDDSRADPAGEVNDDPRLELLQRFIEQLDPLNRAVMLLYLEEHSYRDIAHIIGITETNVASKISRLKQRVRQFDSSQ